MFGVRDVGSQGAHAQACIVGQGPKRQVGRQDSTDDHLLGQYSTDLGKLDWSADQGAARLLTPIPRSGLAGGKTSQRIGSASMISGTGGSLAAFTRAV